MAVPRKRLRPRPAERFVGAEHVLDLPAALRALRAEPRHTFGGHRQIALAHHGPVRLVLFAFSAGGSMREHTAPGWVTIHVLRGTLRVHTHRKAYVVTAGMVLALDPFVPHDIDASEESDMLLGVYPAAASETRAP